MELLLILDEEGIHSLVLSFGRLVPISAIVSYTFMFFFFLGSVGFYLGSCTPSPAKGLTDRWKVFRWLYLIEVTEDVSRTINIHFLSFLISQRSCDECWCISGFKSMIDSVPFSGLCFLLLSDFFHDFFLWIHECRFWRFGVWVMKTRAAMMGFIFFLGSNMRNKALTSLYQRHCVNLSILIRV